jgi:hypothetical protein
MRSLANAGYNSTFSFVIGRCPSALSLCSCDSMLHEENVTTETLLGGFRVDVLQLCCV